MSIKLFSARKSAAGRRQLGMTLIELVMAIVIIGVGLAGVLMVYANTVKASANPMITKQMTSIAEEMMEEIALKTYPVAANAVPAACARNTFNDIRDYAGYHTANFICDIDGTPISSLAGYSINVAVAADTTSLTGVAATQRITVTVTHGAQTITLISWRTDYGT